MSAIPNTINKLVQIMGVVGPKVLDGPPVGVWPDEDCIIIGWSRDVGDPTVGGGGVNVDNVEGFVSTDQERFTVSCLISVVSGDLTVQPLRDRAVGFYDLIGTIIRQDPSLLGSVERAYVSAASMRSYLNQESGGVFEVGFGISCIAFI